MHCSLRLIVLPLYDFQHSLNNTALRINRHRFLYRDCAYVLWFCS
jgi:hypothetical protein